MPEIASLQQGLSRTYGAVPGSTKGTTLTSGATSVKGSWVEITAATERDSHWLLVMAGNPSALQVNNIDIGIGAATEQVIIPNLAGYFLVGGGQHWLFPIFIPAGSRLAARFSNRNSGSVTLDIVLVCFSGTSLFGGASPSIATTYGSTATAGALIDPGGSADTDSAWTELSSAIPQNHHWLCVHGKTSSAAMSFAAEYLVDLGIGAATEQEIVSDLYFSNEASIDKIFGTTVCFPYFVPSGSRLTARLRSSSTTASERAMNIMVTGV